MFEFNQSIFDDKQKEIPKSAQVIFVSDMFANDYVGGAELTTQALIDTSPVETHCVYSKDVTLDLLKSGLDKFWVFCNFSQLNPQTIPSIVGNLRYSIIEYDFKYCKFRSPEKHASVQGSPCNCHEQMNGKVISAFFHGAMGIWWMSEKQQQRYRSKFPFLEKNDNVVLSSVFDHKTLGFMKSLREKYESHERKGWIVLGSESWIKAADLATKWCVDNNKEYEIVWNVSYNDVLEKFAQAEGFVYLPKGGDTCPRMVIEAKLLGCQLELNDNVLHKDEEWFATDNLQEIEEYLYSAPGLFWSGTKKMMDYRPTISGYTTTYNCQLQEYPYKECISSMLPFCDEVVVVDGGSTDGTFEDLQNYKVILEHELGKEVSDKLKLKQVKRDWKHPRFAVFDGMQKAEARKLCTSEFCWQMDSDEIVHEDDAPRILDIARRMRKEAQIIALPVIEYWGGPNKIRVDILPWKWRLSKNDPNITHGIPLELRKFDDEGNLYAAEGTDGCDMISLETGERLPFIGFYTQPIDNIRKATLLGDENALLKYEDWFNKVVNGLPCVFHYSWYDLPRKIRLYRDYWTKHWNSLTGKNTDDTAENNMMFDVPWSEVTEEMIEEKAMELKTKLGGWIWHRKWNGTSKTPHIMCNRTQPKYMKK